MSLLAIYRLRTKSKDLINHGALAFGLVTGFSAYWSWRFKIKKEFLVGHGLSRFNSKPQNVTPWKQQWLTWYRMPLKEYDVYHKFYPYYVIGQFDYTKEILIPKTKNINGRNIRGFDVINPLYCYDGGRFNFAALHSQEESKFISTDRAAIIVNRGWIPYEMKDRKTRPWETNTRQLVKVKGTFTRVDSIHDYKIPNDPSANEWYNIAPEDIARFWELPNTAELKQFYFEQVDIDHIGGSQINNSDEVYKFPLPVSTEEYVRENHKFWHHEKWDKLVYYTLTPVSIFSWGLFLLTL